MIQFDTPRLLQADAYTIGSQCFESKEANEKSVYYLTFRRGPSDYFSRKDSEWSGPGKRGDQRIVFAGISRIIDNLFRKKVTVEEIELTERFLKNRKFTTQETRDFFFPKDLWMRVVQEYDGRIPLKIEAFPEGSVVYPNEPVIRVTAENGFGILAAWFESRILQVWATTERLTHCRHWLEYLRETIRYSEPELSKEEINFYASTMMHDFGDRSAICNEESEILGLTHLYCFAGTDTFAGAYQAWRNGATVGIGGSVDALAHRVVQGFINESDCYRKIYDVAKPGDIISMVGDCYDYKYAVKTYLLPLALESHRTQNGKVVVARPDSGDPLEMVKFTLETAKNAGLYTIINGRVAMTTLRFIQGDSMDWKTMRRIIEWMLDNGYHPHRCGIFGVGGFLRNDISRDNFSTKYALCSVGYQNLPVIKISNSPGKETLPTVSVKRDIESLKSGITIDTYRASDDSLRPYYINGVFEHYSKEIFPEIQDRVINEFNSMPQIGGTVSQAVKQVVHDIKIKVLNEQ